MNDGWKYWSLLAALLWVGIYPAAPALAESINLRPRSSVYYDKQDEFIRAPEGVAFAENSSFYVADSGNGRILHYVFNGEFEFQHTNTIVLPQLRYPTKIQFDPGGGLYVLDLKQKRVARLAPDGTFHGFVPAEATSVVKSFALDRSGNIYLLELTSKQVVVLNQNKEVIREVALPDEHMLLSDVAVDRNGRILTVDAPNGIVYAARVGETRLLPITQPLKHYARFPARLAVDDRGRIYLSDRNGCRILVLGQDGSFLATRSARGWKEGLLQYPGQLHVEKDMLFIADTRNHRIQMFTISE